MNRPNHGNYILRGQKTSNDRYTLIDNNIIQGGPLTHTEVFLLIYLLALPPQWIVRKTEVQKHMKGMSRTKFREAFKGLVNHGHILEEQLYEGNIKNGMRYYVFERPNPEGPETDLPTETPYKIHTEQNTHLENTHLENKEINSSSSSGGIDFRDPPSLEIQNYLDHFLNQRNKIC